jgi:hypothetical protein
MKAGLRRRPTFEGIVEYLTYGQETIRYPDRFAKIIRNHPYLTQLDGEGMMEMQEQQENAWKQQEKENRIKTLKSDMSAGAMRAMRDQGTMAKIISNEQFDRELERAAETFEAESEFRQTEPRDPNRLNSKNQTIRYGLWDDFESDIGSVMEMEGRDSPTASERSESRPPDPSSSSGGPPPPSVGARALSAVGTTANIALTAAKLGWGAWRELSDAMRGPVGAFADMGNRIQGDGTFVPEDYEPWETRGRQLPSPDGQARQSVAIPREAPAPRPKSRARAPSRAPTRSPSTRGRSRGRRSPTPGDIQQGITGGSMLIREDQMGPNVRAAARAIVGAGRSLRGGR